MENTGLSKNLSQNIFCENLDSDEEIMHKCSLKFLDPEIEKEYTLKKHNGKGQLKLIFILFLVLFILICSRVITRMILRLTIKNNQEMIDVYIVVISTISGSLIIEVVLFFTDFLKILRGAFATTLTYFGFVYLSLHVCENSIKEPYFAPPVPILAILMAAIYLLYMTNFICSIICIAIDLAISLVYINMVRYDFWLENVLNNLIYIVGFISLGICVNYVEKFQRNSIYDKVLIEKEKNNLKKVIDKLPEGVVACKEGSICYNNLAFDKICTMQHLTSSISDLKDEEGEESERKGKIRPLSCSPIDSLQSMINEATQEAFTESIQENREMEFPETFNFINYFQVVFKLEILSIKIQIQMKDVIFYFFKDQTIFDKLSRSKERQKSMTLFMGSVTHDLRGPLTGILGISDILIQEPLIISNRELKEYVERIRSSSKLMKVLVQDILDFSRHLSNQISATIKEFNFREIFEDITSVVKIAYKKPIVEFISNVSNNIPTIVNSDENKVMQVIMNLLSNAFKFTTTGRVTASANINNLDGKIYIDIIDSGIGISPENVKKLGKPFMKLADPFKLNQNGIGLGLSNCFNLSHLLGGNITIESVVGQGSKFIFSFLSNLNFMPGSQIELNEESKEGRINQSGELSLSLLDEKCMSSRVLAFHTNSLPFEEFKLVRECECPKILIVDDDRTVSFVHQNYCKKINILFDICENGELALKFVQNKLMRTCCQEYDLILMDYNFDNSSYNGLQAAEMIKREIISRKGSMATKLICLSGSEDSIDTVNKMPNSPFWKAFVKPLKLPQFREIVEQALS